MSAMPITKQNDVGYPTYKKSKRLQVVVKQLVYSFAPVAFALELLSNLHNVDNDYFGGEKNFSSALFYCRQKGFKTCLF
jgi:hypothetical protein